jgi:hypothetical protein
VTFHFRALLWCGLRPIHSYQLCSSIVFTLPYFYCGLCSCVPMERLQNYEQTSLSIEYMDLDCDDTEEWILYKWCFFASSLKKKSVIIFDVYEIVWWNIHKWSVIAHNSAPLDSCTSNFDHHDLVTSTKMYLLVFLTIFLFCLLGLKR